MTLWNESLLPIQWTVVISASLAAALFDVSTRRIPNALTGPLALAGLGFATIVGGLAGLGDASAACVLLAFPFMILFLFAGGGAGDAKLMGAIGSWLGLVNGIIALGAVCIVGTLLAVGQALLQRRLTTVLRNVAGVLRASFVAVVSRGRIREIETFLPENREAQAMPYGVAIFGGVTAAAAGVFVWLSA